MIHFESNCSFAKNLQKSFEFTLRILYNNNNQETIILLITIVISL